MMVSEDMQKALKEEMGMPEGVDRSRGVRLALVHFNEAEADMMWESMEAAHEELEAGEWEAYEEPVHSDEDVSIERLGRFAELQAARRGHPLPREGDVPVVESTGSLKERAERRG